MVQTTEQRYPYKLTRGIIARREGFEQSQLDENGRRTGLKTRPYVHYQARSADNPLAKDELMLTEREAEELNRHGRRVIRLLSGQTSRKDDTQTLEGLMNLMVNARGMSAVQAVRQAIFDSKLLPDTKLPFKKAELVQLLQKAISAKNEASDLAPETPNAA